MGRLESGKIMPKRHSALPIYRCVHCSTLRFTNQCSDASHAFKKVFNVSIDLNIVLSYDNTREHYFTTVINLRARFEGGILYH